MNLGIIILVTCVRGALSVAAEQENKLNTFSGEPLESLEYIFNEAEVSEAITPEERENLQMVFRFAYHLKQSPIASLLEGAEPPEVQFQNIQNLGVEALVNMLKKDPKKLAAFHQEIENYIEKKEHKRAVADQTTSEPGSGNETTACYQDYGAFVEPITDRLYNLAIQLCVQLNLKPHVCPNLPLLPTPPMPNWGLQMIDAMGKIPPGLSQGNLYWTGNSPMCLGISGSFNSSIPQAREFQGQYCRITMQTIKPVSFTGNRSLPLFLGACVPNTCSAENVAAYIQGNPVLNAVMEVVLGMKIVKVFCGNVIKFSENTDAIIVASVIGSLAIVTLLATLYEGLFRKRCLSKYMKSLRNNPGDNDSIVVFDNVVYNDYNLTDESNNTFKTAKQRDLKLQYTEPNSSNRKSWKDTKPGLLERVELAFVGFSAYSNNIRIWRMESKDNHIPVLNGIRALTYCWITMGHAWLYGPLASVTWVTTNLIGALRTFPQKWSFQAVLNFQYASDSFLLLSGFGATYWWLTVHAKRGKVTIGMSVYYFLHKYWRLMPAMMLTLALYGALYRYLGSGPLFPEKITDADNCMDGYIWKNFLMVSNLVSVKHTCGAWTWYIALVFQLHIAAFVVLFPLVIKPVIGYILMAAMYVAYIGATAGESARIHGLEPLLAKEEWVTDYFIVPWCRAGPYVIGMALALLLFEIAKRKMEIRMHPGIAILGWALALVLVCTPIYVTYSFMKVGGVKWSQSAWVAYDTLGRSSWGLGLAWIIFACHTGYGGFITSFLSLPIWLPFCRIGYTSYLINVMVIMNSVFGQNVCIFISGLEQLHKWCAYLLMTYFYGWVFSVLWQYPLSVGLERALLCTNKWEWIKSGSYPDELMEPCHDLGSIFKPSSQGPSQENGDDQTNNEKTAGSQSSEGLHQRQVPNGEAKEPKTSKEDSIFVVTEETTEL